MIDLEPTDIAHGGEAVGRLEGKAYFVDGAMPGEQVRGMVTKDGGSWARVELREVVRASPHRVEPPCPLFGACGGCQWQFADYPTQLEWKRGILAGQLAHLGRVENPPVRDTVAVGAPFGYRNRVDFQVADGRPALSRRRSHLLQPVDECPLLHPALTDLVSRLGDLGDATALTLRVATATGALLAVIDGPVPPQASSWGCGIVQWHRQQLTPLVGAGSIVETVAGVEFRITGDAFFQSNTAGAAVLVGLVAEALSPRPGQTLLDAYAGGGLFGLTVGRGAARVVAVESAPVAADDLRHNAASAPVPVRVVEGATEAALPHLETRWDLAVADPPRTGLGPAGVQAIVAGRPRALAYVSCDPASLARDTRLLAEAGYHLDWATPVDLFPQTFHVETVAAFTARGL
ncbi:MAG TPA: class I SAM-dependent RNA methyltransferase [Acidimicrobiia bacterium]|nr:class I SAM-dependent RNA methyltransferase [Acidimicrobiia bacterium]